VNEAAPSKPRASRIPIIALLLAGSVLASRLLGVVREMVLAAQLGAGAEVDAYRAAFQLPDLLNHLLAGGALSLAFVPFYTRKREREGQEAAEELLAKVLGNMTLLAIVASAALWWWAEEIAALLFDFPPETQALTVRLTRIVLPAQIFFVAGGILRAALMAHDSFRTQALAPVLYNAGIIIGGVGFGARFGAEGFIWGALAGAGVGTFLVPLADAIHSRKFRVRLRVSLLDRDFGRYLWIATPLMLSLTLFVVDEWYERIFGARIGEGVVAQLGYARMLAFAPVAVIGQAVATAALPALSQLWNEGRGEQLDRVLQRTLQAALSLSCLAAGVLIVLAEPLVVVIFERGAFTAEHTLGVASYLRILAAAIPALVAQQIAARGFFARSDMWRPMLLGTAVAFAVVPLYLEFGRRFAGEGLAAAGAVGMSVSATLTLLLLRRVHGGPSLLPIVSTLLRSGGVAGLAAGAAWGTVQLLAVSGGVSFVVGVLVYAIVSIPGVYWVGDEAMRETLSRLRVRLIRRGGGG